MSQFQNKAFKVSVANSKQSVTRATDLSIHSIGKLSHIL